MLRYKRIGLTVKTGLSYGNEAVKMIVAVLKKTGAEVLVDADRCKEFPSSKDMPTFSEEKDIDLLVVIGGDGTILRAVRELKDFSIPILSVNQGAVGFLAEIDMNEAEALIPQLLEGSGTIEERSVLKIRARRAAVTLFEGSVLNEAVISQGSIARLMELKTMVNREHLTTFRADGLIIATPTGSTAYNLSAGGPIVHPGLSAMILTAINSYSFSQKPIVIPGDLNVEVELQAKATKFQDTELILTLDGQTYISLQPKDVVSAHINAKTVKFVRRSEDTFFARLREKLKWGERVE